MAGGPVKWLSASQLQRVNLCTILHTRYCLSQGVPQENVMGNLDSSLEAIMTTAAPQTLTDWDAQLPEAPKPVANYVPCVRTGNLVFTSGVLPMQAGELMATGVVSHNGEAVSVEKATECARQALLNALSVIKAEVGSLSNIKRVVKLTGFVASAPGFDGQPAVMNGASDMLVEVFGPEVGRHARSAVGVNALPLKAPVELELIVELATT